MPKAVNLPTSREPSRYAALARFLEGEIEAGRYAVGAKIPTEEQLQQRFDVSRHTVREALRSLKSRGLVVARAGVGTVVRARAPDTSFMQGAGTVEEVIQFGEAVRMKLLGVEAVVADETLAEHIGAREGQELRRLSILRHRAREAEPAGWVRIYLRPEHADVVDRVERAREPVLRLVQKLHGARIAEVLQRIVATTLTAGEARTLRCRAGRAALLVTRQYLDPHGRLLMATVGLYPSDRFSHNTRFRIQEA